MKLNKFKTIAPAAALLLSASLSSCMADLDKGNIDPNVETNPSTLGLYTKCYAGLIMEGNDGKADFTIDDDGKSPYSATFSTSTSCLPTKLSAGGQTVDLRISATTSTTQPHQL